MRTVFDPTDPGSHAYGLLTSIVVPRPIAWISTLDADGVGNLAPHSFFTVVSAHPAMVSFTSVGRKDTVRNVVATGHFVVNLVTEDLAELANASSAPFAPEVDEAQTLGVRLEPSAVVPVPPRRGLAGIDRVHPALDARPRRRAPRRRRGACHHRRRRDPRRRAPDDRGAAAGLPARARRVGALPRGLPPAATAAALTQLRRWQFPHQ
ncbi:hypothetical protein B277_01025 [Janibacter hoylei PVAS-1]|uniref:Flavin reductase like domain-containing protein n=1 Tax=Janibacter hoylei PVAS-1 TaxID=1210046 RepID=K1E6U1_9MICO|nr:flavin reductase family protein [Janibacter hoylei]EKA62756.1 hypothetical protein B277_01025 [Janibacter hoylei PVAS-1]